MAKVLRCSNCGAAVKYDIRLDEMQCPFCDTSIPLFKIKEQEKELESEQTETKTEKFSFNERFEELQGDAEYMDYDGIKCNSCGAELIHDSETVATKCAFCGSPNIISERLSGGLKPDKIIPFRITKERAKEIIREWTGSNPYVPDSITKEELLDNIQGIYVPFFLYDYDVHSEVVMRTETRDSHIERERDIIGTRMIEATVVRQFIVEKEMDISYGNIPADASKKKPDVFMDNIEPYDYSWLRDFDMAYLSGFYAEKTNFDSKEIEYRTRKKLRKFINDLYEERLSKTSGTRLSGTSKTNIIGENLYIKTKKKNYALLPIWYLNYKYNGNDYFYAINGQSGKCAGDLPVSSEKVTGCNRTTSSVFVIIYIVSAALFLLGFSKGLIIGLLFVPIHIASLKRIDKPVPQYTQSYDVYSKEYTKPLSYRESKEKKTLLKKYTERRYVDMSDENY